MSFLAPLLAAAATFGLLAWILAIYMRRMFDSALTDQFRAAEAISRGHTPARWVAEIERRLALRRVLRPLLGEASGTDLATRKIDRLYRFFAASQFFEDATARELLLNLLRETRVRWAAMTWEAISNERFRSGAVQARRDGDQDSVGED